MKRSTASHGAGTLMQGLVIIPGLEAQGIEAAEMTRQRKSMVDYRGDEMRGKTNRTP